MIGVITVAEGKKVAIIGSGIAGSSLAHFLSEVQEGDTKLELHVFERKRIGGRMYNHEIPLSSLVRLPENGQLLLGFQDRQVVVELGGTIYHHVNTMIDRLVKFVGLVPDPGEDGLETDTFGIWQGEYFGFETASFPSFPWLESGLNLLHMFTRYGPVTLWRFEELLSSTVKKYLDIYPSVESATKVFKTPREFLLAMDPAGSMVDLISENLCDFMEIRHGLSETYVREFASAVTRVQYNQNCSLNALVGMVALLPVVDDVCYRISGGNMHLPERLIARSKAILHSSEVIQIAKTAEGKYLLRSRMEGIEGQQTEEFDIIAIAAPLEMAGITFVGEDLVHLNVLPRRTYQITYVTMVSGVLNPLYFGRTADLPQCILTTSNDEVIPFSSLCSNTLLDPFDPDWRLYKIFSKNPMNNTILDSLFTSRRYLLNWVWHAYPQLPPMLNVLDSVGFELHPSLYYVNAMETIFSTMETEALSALNIKNLIVQSLNQP